jgi:hypothetical protein
MAFKSVFGSSRMTEFKKEEPPPTPWGRQSGMKYALGNRVNASSFLTVYFF